ncbi:MAG: HAD family phosphatase [Simkaniaceae bacterium]
MIFQNYDLFLFDFDGLLVNTEPLHFEAYKSTLQKMGYSLSWDFNLYCNYAHRDQHREALYREFPLLNRDWEGIRKRKNSHYETLLQKVSVPLMPGIEDFLNELLNHKKKFGVVTNSLKSSIDKIVKKNPTLQKIPYWFTREDYESPKPHPDGYLKALEAFSIEANKTIGFEDTLKGLNALHLAKIKPILICDPNHPQLKASINFPYTHIPTISSIH